MKLVSVAGTCSNVGKTAVCEMLIRSFNNSGNNHGENRGVNNNSPLSGNVSALKITTRHKGVCTKGSCGVCDSIKYPYVIKDDKAVILQEGKDTARLNQAGATNVVWLLSYPETLKEGVSESLNCFDKNDIVVIEGNSFLSVHDVDIAVMVTKPSYTELKKSAEIILDKIDITLINKEEDTTSEQIKDTEDWLKSIGNKAPVFSVNPYLDDPMLTLKEIGFDF
ncbi:MAG: hypothetical protein ACUZ8O_04165 [Candidatus Anammoxibacter sp.]